MKTYLVNSPVTLMMCLGVSPTWTDYLMRDAIDWADYFRTIRN